MGASEFFMHVVLVRCTRRERDARDAKGTQRRGGRRGRRACVMHEMITLALVVSFGIALIFKSNKETAKR